MIQSSGNLLLTEIKLNARAVVLVDFHVVILQR